MSQNSGFGYNNGVPTQSEHDNASIATWQNIFLHEFGHVLRLEHPWDSDDGDHAVATCSEAHEDTRMGYTDHLSGKMERYELIDVQALQSIWGTDGGYSHDQVNGSTDGDVIRGAAGIDTLSGGAGSDLIYGNKDLGRLVGGSGADTLFGGQQSDTVFGLSGADQVYGNKQDDSCMVAPVMTASLEVSTTIFYMANLARTELMETEATILFMEKTELTPPYSQKAMTG